VTSKLPDLKESAASKYLRFYHWKLTRAACQNKMRSTAFPSPIFRLLQKVAYLDKYATGRIRYEIKWLSGNFLRYFTKITTDFQ